ncbi:MAG: Maf family protein [Pseudomonadota bacterium]
MLRTLGLEFEQRGVGIDETPLPGEPADALVLRLAREKAQAAAAAGQVVLAADTAVVLDDEVFGKPADRSDALAMLARLSGREHTVLTGVAVVADGELATALSRTRVAFREIGRDEALHYWQSGEPRDKAGAYGIQGLGGVFVSHVSGSYSGVVGLPVFETARLLRDAGIFEFPQAREARQ